jgi:hypothetical protein
VGAFFTRLVPLVFLLSAITIIVSYEDIDLLKKSMKKRQYSNHDMDSMDFDKKENANNIGYSDKTNFILRSKTKK